MVQGADQVALGVVAGEVEVVGVQAEGGEAPAPPSTSTSMSRLTSVLPVVVDGDASLRWVGRLALAVVPGQWVAAGRLWLVARFPVPLRARPASLSTGCRT
ncbi:hypothetical protein ACFYZ2_05460 [Streptomyces sviceus]|uniref:hypothetical protein n=1 Tax=Streptomyces sviceus TaxID=285530 RepID=UPI0036D14C8E